jgi:hypothetical protein
MGLPVASICLVAHVLTIDGVGNFEQMDRNNNAYYRRLLCECDGIIFMLCCNLECVFQWICVDSGRQRGYGISDVCRLANMSDRNDAE